MEKVDTHLKIIVGMKVLGRMEFSQDKVFFMKVLMK